MLLIPRIRIYLLQDTHFGLITPVPRLRLFFLQDAPVTELSLIQSASGGTKVRMLGNLDPAGQVEGYELNQWKIYNLPRNVEAHPMLKDATPISS